LLAASKDATQEVTPKEQKLPSSIKSINILMLLFYGTLGSVMPYLPIFYKYIGANGEFLMFPWLSWGHH
jgi:hypothetical protein